MSTVIRILTVKLNLSRLIGKASHPDMQKCGLLDFSLKIGYIGSLKFGCYYLDSVSASKSFELTI